MKKSSLKAVTTIFLLSVVALLGISSSSCAQSTDGSPEWVVESYFSRQDFPDLQKYLAGELARDTVHFGAFLPDDFRVTYRTLQRHDSSAVIAATARNDSTGTDFYCFLKHSERWQIEAIRTLWLPALVLDMIDSLEARPVLDDTLSTLLARFKLLLSTDSVLTAFWVDHRTDFESIVDDYRNQNKQDVDDRMHKLHLTMVYEDSVYSGCVFIMIGGMIDNEAGYVFTEDESNLPEITSSYFIMIEKIAPHWYLYKTT